MKIDEARPERTSSQNETHVTERPSLPHGGSDDVCSEGGTPPPSPRQLPRVGTTLGPPLSVGSIGHPHNCGSACRYVKRQGGCRDGVLCPQCHLCFWHRKAVAVGLQPSARPQQEVEPDTPPWKDDLPNVPSNKDSPAEEGKDAAIAWDGCSTDPQPVSIGTRAHPHHCGAPCKYVRRKTGCRHGAACINCHVCQWRRGSCGEKGLHLNSGDNTARGFAPNATETLSKLIRLQIFCRGEELTGTSGRARPSTSGTSDDVSRMSAHEHLGGAVPVDAAGVSPSVGSIGHPQSCGLACKYVSKSSGCKDGWLCSRCHLCLWQRKLGMSTQGSKSNGEQEALIETSFGSVGHPGNCREPCKYVRRKGGCRDGWQCQSCHLCQWTRRSPVGVPAEKSNADSDQEPQM